jgi:hypothetical protein
VSTARNLPPNARRAQSRVAALKRHHPDDTAALASARQEFAYAVAEARVREIVDAAPPLTEEQRRRLARLLDSGAAS